MNTVRYLSRHEITQSQIDVIVKYRDNIYKIVKWSGSKRRFDIKNVTHFKIELARVDKWLAGLQTPSIDEAEAAGEIAFAEWVSRNQFEWNGEAWTSELGYWSGCAYNTNELLKKSKENANK